MGNQSDSFFCHLTTGRFGAQFSLHFNRMIPRLHIPHGHFAHMPPVNLANLTPTMRSSVAKRLAKINVGRTPVEMAQPIDVFRGFLTSLGLIDGLIGLGHPHSYALEFDAGLLFDSLSIGRQIGLAVHESFYPELEFEYSVDPEMRVPGQTMVGGSSLDIKSIDPSLDETPF